MFRFRQLAIVAAVGITLSVGLSTSQAQSSINDGQDDLVIYYCPNPPITNGNFAADLDAWDWEFNANAGGMATAEGFVDVIADPSGEPEILPAPEPDYFFWTPPEEGNRSRVPDPSFESEEAVVGQDLTYAEPSTEFDVAALPEYAGADLPEQPATVDGVLLMQSSAAPQPVITLSIGSELSSRLSVGQTFTFCQGGVLRARAKIGFAMLLDNACSAGFTVTMHLDNLTTGATASRKLDGYHIDWPCEAASSITGNTDWTEYELSIANLGATSGDELEAWFSIDMDADSQVPGSFPSLVVGAMIDDVRIEGVNASFQPSQGTAEPQDESPAGSSNEVASPAPSGMSVQYAAGHIFAQDSIDLFAGSDNGAGGSSDGDDQTDPARSDADDLPNTDAELGGSANFDAASIMIDSAFVPEGAVLPDSSNGAGGAIDCSAFLPDPIGGEPDSLPDDNTGVGPTSGVNVGDNVGQQPAQRG